MMPKQRQSTSLEKLIALKKNYRKIKGSVESANEIAIEQCLAGSLDLGGHHVEVRERVIGGQIIKFLIIDGES